MKAKEKNARPEGAGKQQKQLLVLGGLVAVLGVVLAVQFGGSDPSAEAAALSAPDPAAAGAPAPAPAAPVVAEAGAAAPAPPPVADNPVLSQAAPEEGLLRSPFANFWNAAQEGEQAVAGTALPDIAPPAVTLNATMPSATRALAVIDGEMHAVGDSIQGWELAEIQPRRIVLRSPAKAVIEISMPLLVGSRVAGRAESDG